MFGPLFPARIEKRRDLIRVGIDAREIRSFSKVALSAGEREIVRKIASAMFARNNMFNLQGNERRIDLPALAILAALARSPAD